MKVYKVDMEFRKLLAPDDLCSRTIVLADSEEEAEFLARCTFAAYGVKYKATELTEKQVFPLDKKRNPIS